MPQDLFPGQMVGRKIILIDSYVWVPAPAESRDRRRVPDWAVAMYGRIGWFFPVGYEVKCETNLRRDGLKRKRGGPPADSTGILLNRGGSLCRGTVEAPAGSRTQAVYRGFSSRNRKCGEGGIRTLDTLASILPFQGSALGHYATSPSY